MRKVLRYHERDVIRLKKPGGGWQGWYKSSGRNSGSKNCWFPFDGVLVQSWAGHSWFIKNAYCSPEIDAKGLHRFGTEENKRISEKLAKENIPMGIEVNEVELNKFLGRKDLVKDWEIVYENCKS